MLLSRPFAHRRATLLGLAGALMLCTFLALPQGQAFAASLLLFFRGTTVKAVPTDMAHIKNAYATLYELDQIGTRQGTVPTGLNRVASVAQAASVSKLMTLAEPNPIPAGLNKTPNAQAIAPSHVVLTLKKAKADAYFQADGSALRMPAKFNNAQLIVDFPGVALLEYGGTNAGKLFVGQAGQLVVNISGNNITIDEMRNFLLSMPGLSADTVTALKNITNWTTTIPLAVPTDKAGWSNTSVGGSFAGQGVILNDNTGIGSALLWQTANGTRSIGIAGYGLKATDLQNIAGSLK
jgi:hypothetical protein